MNFQMTLALRYLAGRRLRTVLTTLAIVFGIVLIFGMNAILPAFVKSFTANAMAMEGQVDVSITSKTSGPFPVDILDTVKGVDGVTVASGTLERPVSLPADYFDNDPAAPDRVTSIILIGAVPEDIHSVIAFNIIEGRFLEAGDEAATVIAKSLADAAGLKLGDTLRLPTATGEVELVIVGMTPQRLMPGSEEVLITLPQAQKLLDAPGQINLIKANFDSTQAARRAEIEANIEAALGSGYTLGVLQAGAEILQNIGLAQGILTFLGALGLMMGGFIIFNTFRTIVAERRHDIGMLRAVGAGRHTITWMILIEGTIQGVVGTILGMLLGYLMAVAMLNLLQSLMRQYLNTSMGAPDVTPGLVLVSVALGVGITLLAGWLPARSASRMTPLEALRPEIGKLSLKRMAGLGFWSGVVMITLALLALLSGNPGLLGLGSFLLVIGLIAIGPALITPIARLFGSLAALSFARDGAAQLAESNLSRQPSRAAITASTTMISLAILVMAASILSSVMLTFSTMLEESLGSDYLLVPPTVSLWGADVGAAPDLADELRAVDGVAVVSTMRFASSQVNEAAAGLLGVDPRAYDQTSGLTFTQGDPATAYRELENGRAMIANGILASSAGVKLGDSVVVLTPTGEQSYRIVGVASDFLNAKTNTGYVSQANIAADFGCMEDVFFQINLEPDADRESVEAAFREAVKPYPQFNLIAGREYLDQNIDLFHSAFAGMYGMVIFLSIPSLIAMVNTLAIGVIERTREIGMLRAVGSTRRQIRAIVLAEAIILSAIGTSFGLLAGLYMGRMAVASFALLGFPADYIFPWQGVILAIAGGLIFGALAAIIPARQAARLEIVQALRYE
ncbi:MAG: FtsX-like permease family protein [Anaerolineae bacterium]|nr:FtsX-like permease family protein [Anaerolineae bacterium]